MKKFLALLLILLCCLTQTLAQPAMLTVDEMLAFCDMALEDALTGNPVSASAAEDGGYMFVFDSFTLYTKDAQLTQNAVVTGVEFNNADYLQIDMRGVLPSDSLSDLLAAYPLDNTNLQGAYDEAVLYISGLLPDTVNCGRVVRNGSHVLAVEHAIYTMDGERVEKSCVVYTLENNFVTGIQVLPGVQYMTLEDALQELSDMSLLQEVSEYSVYTADVSEPFVREDLTFGGMDFLTVTPESALSLWGSANSDTWVDDGVGYMRTMQWEDMQLIFSYDRSRQNSRLLLMQVYGEGVEGPRSLHLGDSVESVLVRFARAEDCEEGQLYGDGRTAPYGLYEVRDDGSVYVLYAAATEEGTVLLALNFIGNELVDITCTYL